MRFLVKLGVICAVVLSSSLEALAQDDIGGDTAADILSSAVISALDEKVDAKCSCDVDSDDLVAELNAYGKCVRSQKTGAFKALAAAKLLVKYSGQSQGSLKSDLNAEVEVLISDCDSLLNDSGDGGGDPEEGGGGEGEPIL